jgi:hypothetical protein
MVLFTWPAAPRDAAAPLALFVTTAFSFVAGLAGVPYNDVIARTRIQAAGPQLTRTGLTLLSGGGVPGATGGDDARRRSLWA